MPKGAQKIQTSSGTPAFSQKAQLDSERNRHRLSKSFKHGQSGPLQQVKPNTRPLPQHDPQNTGAQRRGRRPQGRPAKSRAQKAIDRAAKLRGGGKSGILPSRGAQMDPATKAVVKIAKLGTNSLLISILITLLIFGGLGTIILLAISAIDFTA